MPIQLPKTLKEELADQESDQLAKLKAGDQHALRWFFELYYTACCRVAYGVIGDEDQAQDVAQEVFIEIWRKREALQIDRSFGPYLRTATRNRALNRLRGQKTMSTETEGLVLTAPRQAPTGEQKLNAEDLQSALEEALELLPERCRLVFTLSRYDQLSYKEIAAAMEISIKTVENQMGKALKLLRNELSSFLSASLLIPSLLSLFQ